MVSSHEHSLSRHHCKPTDSSLLVIPKSSGRLSTEAPKYPYSSVQQGWYRADWLHPYNKPTDVTLRDSGKPWFEQQGQQSASERPPWLFAPIGQTSTVHRGYLERSLGCGGWAPQEPNTRWGQELLSYPERAAVMRTNAKSTRVYGEDEKRMEVFSPRDFQSHSFKPDPAASLSPCAAPRSNAARAR